MSGEYMGRSRLQPGGPPAHGYSPCPLSPSGCSSHSHMTYFCPLTPSVKLLNVWGIYGKILPPAWGAPPAHGYSPGLLGPSGWYSQLHMTNSCPLKPSVELLNVWGIYGKTLPPASGTPSPLIFPRPPESYWVVFPFTYNLFLSIETISDAPECLGNILKMRAPGLRGALWLNIFRRLLGRKLHIGTSLYDTLK
jgi:hypothetical protein